MAQSNTIEPPGSGLGVLSFDTRYASWYHVDMTNTTTTVFPIDWNEWRAEWKEQRSTLRLDGKTSVPRGMFPGRNFLADEVLGVFRTQDGRWVELAEVTFPALGRDGVPHRYVGLTFDDGNDSREAVLAESWDELRSLLGVG